MSSTIAMTAHCFGALSHVRQIWHCVIGHKSDLLWPDWLNWRVWKWVPVFEIQFFCSHPETLELTGKCGIIRLCFYQTRSAWSMDQGSNKNHSPAYHFAPTVTKFCVMWEGSSLPHDTKFSNSRCEIVDSRAFPSWSLIHGLRWSGLIKVGPETLELTGKCGIIRWIPQKTFDDKSTLIQVMAWCHQAPSHYLNQCWPKSLMPNGMTQYNALIHLINEKYKWINEWINK